MNMKKRLEHFVEGENEDYLEYKKLAQQIPKYSNVFNLIAIDSQRHASYFKRLLLGEEVTDYPISPKRIKVPEPPQGNGVWNERLREELSAIMVYLAFGEENKKLKPLMRSIVADELRHFGYLKKVRARKRIIKVAPRKNPVDLAFIGASMAASVIAALVANALIAHDIRKAGMRSPYWKQQEIEDKVNGNLKKKRKTNPPIDWDLTGSIGKMVAMKDNKKVVVNKSKNSSYRFRFYRGNKKLIDTVEYNTDNVIELTTFLVTENPDKIFSTIEKVYDGKLLRNPISDFVFVSNNPVEDSVEDYIEDIATRYEAHKFEEVHDLWKEFSKTHTPEQTIQLYRGLKRRGITLSVTDLKGRYNPPKCWCGKTGKYQITPKYWVCEEHREDAQDEINSFQNSLRNNIPTEEVSIKNRVYFSDNNTPGIGGHVYYDKVKAESGADLIPDIDTNEPLEVISVGTFGDRKYANVEMVNNKDLPIIGKNLYVDYLFQPNWIKEEEESVKAKSRIGIGKLTTILFNPAEINNNNYIVFMKARRENSG